MVTAPVIFISVPYSDIINEPEIQWEKEMGINLILNSDEIDMPAVLNYLSKFNNHYIFSLPGEILNNNTINKLLPRLYTLFTLSPCFRKNNNNIPVFLNGHNDHIHHLQ